MKNLTALLVSLLIVACAPNNDGFQRHSTDWCKVRIPAGWSTVEDTRKENGRTVNELHIADPTSNVMINIQNLSPPIPNPGWNFAHQMLSNMNEISEQEEFSGSEAPSVSRYIGSQSTVAYCMTVMVSDSEYPRQLTWETFKVSHSISDTFIIVTYPIGASHDTGTVIDLILKSLRVMD